MTTFIPNRVSAGVRTGGQFAEKINSEADFDLPSDEVESDDYKLTHHAPYRDEDGYYPSMDRLTDLMPESVYENPEWYANGSNANREVRMALQATRGNPDAVVRIYRAVPKGVARINAGDWVTTSYDYAEQHGNLSPDDGGFVILQGTAKASDLFSEGNCVEEFGYDPAPSEDNTEAYDKLKGYERFDAVSKRAHEVDSEIMSSVRSVPTFENYREHMERNRKVVLDSLRCALDDHSGAHMSIPGDDAGIFINQEFQSANTRPEVIGGARVRLVRANGKSQTFEVRVDEDDLEKDVPSYKLQEMARKKFRLRSESGTYRAMTQTFDSALNESGSATNTKMEFQPSPDGDDFSIEHMEITYLPTRAAERRAEFTEETGQNATLSDGWL